MPGLLERVASGLGQAYGAYRRGVQQVLGRGRAAFLSAWAESARWTGGDYQAQAAQRRALMNSWVFTAIGLIVREVSAARFEVVQQSDVDDDPVKLPNHPLEQLVRRPNPFMGRAFLWQYTGYWLELAGNAYWYLGCEEAPGSLRGVRPVEIWPLPARDVEPVPGDAERFVDYYEYTVNGRIYRISAEWIVHFKLPNPFDVFRGLSPLTAAMLPADADMAMARWNGTFFGRDNVMPSAIINLSSGDPTVPINPVDAERLKADLRGEYQAAARKTAITTANAVSAVLLGWNPKDMDFIAGRQFTKEEIYAIYGVPSGLLDKNATEANATIADRVLKEKTVWPLLCLIAEQATAQVAMPFYGADLEARFQDIRPVNRAMELQEVAQAGQYLWIDEVRKKYWQLDPLPNGEGQRLPAAGPGGELGLGGPLGLAGDPALALRADLRRWRDKALKAVKAGKGPDVPFESAAIPADVAGELRGRLAIAHTADEVKAAFDAAAEVAASPFPVTWPQNDGGTWEQYG